MAREVYDYLSNEGGDILIKDGDFVIGESTEQHIHDMLLSHKGEWREFPWFGVGLTEYLKDEGQKVALRKEIEKMMSLDGAIPSLIKLNELPFVVEGAYK